MGFGCHFSGLNFDGETDTTALADFYLHEMRFGGKRIVDVLADPDTELTQDERDLLAAHRNSRCSLFAIISADAVACQIELRDLLEPAVPEVALKEPGVGDGPSLRRRCVNNACLAPRRSRLFRAT
jgi:hypothetical protein